MRFRRRDSGSVKGEQRIGAMLCRPVAVLGYLLLGVAAALPAALADSGRWAGQVAVEIKPGSERSLGRFDVFWPFWQASDRLLYVDGRVVDASGADFEGNLGLGYRQLLPEVRVFNSDVVYGVYGFFDRRKTRNDNFFSQGTFGAELMTSNFSLRGNAYLPERSSPVLAQRTLTTGAASSGSVAITGTSVVVAGRTSASTSTLTARERALPGFDVEFGARIPLEQFSFPENHDLWLYGGYYRFDRSQTPTLRGVKGRLEYSVYDAFGWSGSQMSVGAEVQDDDLRGSQTFAIFRLRVPFGVSADARQDRRQARIARMMTAFVERDVDVVTVAQNIDAPAGSPFAPDRQDIPGARLPDTPVNDPLSGQPLNVYFVDATGGGDCAQATPCTVSTAQAEPTYGPGDTLVVVANMGPIVSDIAMAQPRQKVIGGGDSGSATVVLSSGDTINLASLGARATVNGTVTLGNDSEVRGFDITNAGGDGLAAVGATGFTVSDVNVNGAAVGIRATGASSGTFSGVSVSNSTTAGVALDGVTSTVSFDGGTFTNNAGAAFDVNGGSGTVNLADVIINQTAGPAGMGISIDGGSSTVNFTGASSLTQSVASPAIDIVNGHSGTFTQAASATIVANASAGMSSNTGLSFDTADGTYTFNGTTSMSGRSRVTITDSDGTFSFGANTSIVSPTSGIAFDVSGGTADVVYNGDITNASAFKSVRVSNGHSGPVTFQGGTISQSAAGRGLDFNDADGAYRFIGTSNLGGANSDVVVSNGSVGTFEFRNLSIATDPMWNADAIRIFATDAAGTANVTIANSALTTGGIRATNQSTGTLCLDISGNTLAAGTIAVRNTGVPAGIVNVVQASAAALGVANGGAPVSVSGAITFGTPGCP